MLLSLSRNALAVLAGTVLAYACARNGSKPFTLTGKVGRGLPPFQMPPFSTTFENRTYNFEEMLKVYDGSVAFVPLIAILECIAIAKAFGNKFGTFERGVFDGGVFSEREDAGRHSRAAGFGVEQHFRVVREVDAGDRFLYEDGCE